MVVLLCLSLRCLQPDVHSVRGAVYVWLCSAGVLRWMLNLQAADVDNKPEQPGSGGAGKHASNAFISNRSVSRFDFQFLHLRVLCVAAVCLSGRQGYLIRLLLTAVAVQWLNISPRLLRSWAA